MTRRGLLSHLLLTPWAALAVAGAWLQSCGSDATTQSYAMTPLGACDGRAPAIGSVAGHTHAACVPMDALDAGGSYVMQLQPSAGHSHVFSISSVDMATLLAGGMLAGLSDSDAFHQHAVTFS